MNRYQQEQEAGLVDQSRRPHTSPRRSSPELEQQVIELRRKHPAWGGRKLRRRLPRQSDDSLPAASTISAILHRHGLIDEQASAKRVPYKRFQRERANELWQMDFKSPITTTSGGELYPLTVLDDHSRFALNISACSDQTGK